METTTQARPDERRAAQALFKRHFGHSPAQFVQAPGQLTLLGDLAAASQGIALTVAVERQVFIAAAPRPDGKIELVSAAGGNESFWLDNLDLDRSDAWAGPIKAVLAELRRRGVNFNGFNAAVYNAIPAGFGSLGALEAATALLVRQLHPFTLTEAGIAPPPRRDARTLQLPPPTDLELRAVAGMCRAARARWSSPAASPVEHLTPLLGRAWQTLTVDCQFSGVERWPFAGTAVVFCGEPFREPSPPPTGLGVRPSTGALDDPRLSERQRTAALEDADASSDPAKQPHHSKVQFTEAPGDSLPLATPHPVDDRECLISATQKLGVKSLRAVDAAMLNANQAKLNEREFAVTSHAIAETHWVVRSEGALREGDHRQVGAYLRLSHESARERLRTVSAEADALVEIANHHGACLGARALVTEGRDAIVCLANYHEVESFVAHLGNEGRRESGRAVEPMVCPIADGAK